VLPIDIILTDQLKITSVYMDADPIMSLIRPLDLPSKDINIHLQRTDDQLPSRLPKFSPESPTLVLSFLISILAAYQPLTAPSATGPHFIRWSFRNVISDLLRVDECGERSTNQEQVFYGRVMEAVRIRGRP
jgi:hypothetical protein